MLSDGANLCDNGEVPLLKIMQERLLSKPRTILMLGYSHINLSRATPRAVAIARAHAWMEAMESGKFRNLTQLAQAVGVDEGYVRRQLTNSWLSQNTFSSS